MELTRNRDYYFAEIHYDRSASGELLHVVPQPIRLLAAEGAAEAVEVALHFLLQDVVFARHGEHGEL